MSAVTTPNLLVQRNLAALAVVLSETSDITLLTSAIYNLVTAIAAQTQTSVTVLKVQRDLVTAMPGQTQTSTASLTRLMRLVNTFAIESQTSEVGFMWAGYIPEHLRVRALLSQLQAELSAPALRAELALRQLKGE